MASKSYIEIPQILYQDHLKTINNIQFTKREIDIVSCILAGKAAKIIAIFLTISSKTVESHIYNIMKKLGCNSRQGIISFIEKSGKFLVFQDYYVQLLLQKSFEQALKKVSSLVEDENLKCLFSYDKEILQHHFLLIKQLEKYFYAVGIKVILDQTKDIYSHSHPLKINYKLYIIDSEEKYFQIFMYENLEKNSLNNIPIILLFLTPSLPLSFSEQFKNQKFIYIIKYENYYESFINILKKFLPSLKIEKIFSEFNNNYCNDFSSVKKYIEKKEIGTSKKGERTILKKISNLIYLIKNKKYFYVFEFLITIISILTFVLGFFFYKNEKPSLSSEFSFIRSDLHMPPETIFLKRPQFINKMREKLAGNQGIQTVALVGIGGTGKTTLARQFGQLQETCTTWEINAKTKNNLLASFKELAYRLAKSQDQKKELEFVQIIQNSEEKEKQLLFLVKKWLKQKNSWVLIYDNVESLSDIRNYLAEDSKMWGNGKVIITTTDSNIVNTAYIKQDNIIHIDEMEKEESFSLFNKIVGKSEKELSLNEKEKLKIFLENIPSFPLDITLAAYYIKNSQINYNQYLERLGQYNKEFEKAQEDLLTEISDYTKTRYGIIISSLEKLTSTKTRFKEFLFFICLLDSKNIPKNLLEQWGYSLEIEEYIRILKKYSFITTELNNEEKGGIGIHRSIQTIILTSLIKSFSIKEQEKLIEKIVSIIDSLYKVYTEKNCKDRILFLPHVDSLYKNIKNLNISKKLKEKLEINLMLDIGFSNTYCLGNFIVSKNCLSKAFNLQKNKNILKKTTLARVLKELGNSYLNLGEMDDALFYFQESIKLYKKIPHSEIPIAENLKHIGYAHIHKRNFKKAEYYYKEALCIINKIDPKLKKELESNIYSRLSSLYNLTYLNYNKNNKAEIYALKSLELLNASDLLYDKQISPEISCFIARHRRVLGQVYSQQGRYEEAMEKGFKEANYLIENSTNYCQHDSLQFKLFQGIGEVDLRQGRLEDAKEKLTKSLQIYERLVGDYATLTARVLRAETLIRLNRITEAEADCEAVFKLKKRPHDNYSELLYISISYHAAIIKYKQKNFKKSAEYFSDFFKQMKYFCKDFLEEEKFKDLESKRVFVDINLDKFPSKDDITQYLKYSTHIFSAIYGPDHLFVKDYVLKN